MLVWSPPGGTINVPVVSPLPSDGRVVLYVSWSGPDVARLEFSPERLVNTTPGMVSWKPSLELTPIVYLTGAEVALGMVTKVVARRTYWFRAGSLTAVLGARPLGRARLEP